MTDTTRDLIQRLADELDRYRRLLRDDRRETHPLANEARAYLAQPELDDSADDELPPKIGHILKLAAIIREVDGNHSLGAAALAEAILSHRHSRWIPAKDSMSQAE